MATRTAGNSPKVVLTDRDGELVVSLFKYRYLSVPQVQRLHFPSTQTATRRLRLLERSGYLSTFRAPGVDDRIAYLTEKGAGLVADRLAVPLKELGWRRRGETPKDYYFLKHFLAAGDFRITVTQACERSNGVEFLGFLPEHEGERTATGAVRKYLREVVADIRQPGTSITHTPDGVFAIQKGDAAALFLLEIDRGTEMLADAERGFAKTLRFCLNYLSRGGFERYREDFGVTPAFQAVRVLVVTPSSRRLQNMRAVGAGLGFEPRRTLRFIWLTSEELVSTESILGPIWVTLDPADGGRYAIDS